MRVRATAVAEGRGGGSGAFGLPVLVVLVIVGLVVGMMFLSGLRETVMLASPEVREAQARQSVAESNYRASELARQTRSADAQAAIEASWRPWVIGAGQLALVALLAAVAALLVAGPLGVALLLRRHLSLPTSDGRVPLVGLDRELSREALFRYQALRGSGPSFEALPLDQPRACLELDVLDVHSAEEKPS